MLTSSQRESIRSGEIRDKGMMKIRIRENLLEAIADLNTIMHYHSWIEGRQSMSDLLDSDETAELVSNLLYVLDTDEIDENVLYLLVDNAKESWTVPGSGNVHGHKEELGIRLLLESFSEFDPDDEMSPDPTDFEGWDELVDLVDRLS